MNRKSEELKEKQISEVMASIENRVRHAYNQGYEQGLKAHNMAMEALKQEPILDKIRAEIEDEADYAYADFDRYKEDILHAESDELPDDDFRYGLRRAIEIIDKYKESWE